jgi:hypothetical protein
VYTLGINHWRNIIGRYSVEVCPPRAHLEDKCLAEARNPSTVSLRVAGWKKRRANG